MKGASSSSEICIHSQGRLSRAPPPEVTLGGRKVFSVIVCFTHAAATEGARGEASWNLGSFDCRPEVRIANLLNLSI